MNALTAYERMDDLLSSAFPTLLRGALARDWSSARLPGEMKLDVSETEQAYLVKAQIPGARKEDVKVKIDGNFVAISAEVKEEKEARDDKTRSLTRELYYGSLSRGLALQHEVNETEAQASFDHGVLSLTLPKRAEAKGTTLKIA